MGVYLLQAFRGINSNKSRTFLTTLGIMIGIGTVVLVLATGNGFKGYIDAQVELFGSNTLTIETIIPASTKARNQGAENGGPAALNAVPVTTFRNKDIEDIRNLPNVVNAYGATFGQQVTTYRNISKNSLIFGADAARFDIDKGVIYEGRPFTEEENRSLAQVAVLGYDIAEDFFGNTNGIGKYIRIGNYNFEVIGIYERRGSFGASNDDAQIYIPIRTLQKKITGIDYLFYGIVELENPNIGEATALDVADVMRRNHDISDENQDDFLVRTQEQNLETFNTILNGITFLLIAIALISLIVGGVGVMNIMYVVITERIGEIGLKKALGARNKDILFEFLIEAILLTLLGGIIGILTGGFLAFIIAKVAQGYGFDWPFSVPILGIILAVSLSMAVGIIFGVFPARNASKLNPIEALNKE